MTSSSKQSALKASSMLVPAVFLVLRNMNLCSWLTIMRGMSALLLSEKDGEVLEDRAEMNLGNFQRRGDVLELLALFAGDAVVGKQHEIGGADDLFLGFLAHPAGGSGELGQHVSFARIGLDGPGNAAHVDGTAGLVLIDLLDQTDLARIEPAVRRGHRHHRLEDPIRVSRFVHHQCAPRKCHAGANCAWTK